MSPNILSFINNVFLTWRGCDSVEVQFCWPGLPASVSPSDHEPPIPRCSMETAELLALLRTFIHGSNGHDFLPVVRTPSFRFQQPEGCDVMLGVSEVVDCDAGQSMGCCEVQYDEPAVVVTVRILRVPVGFVIPIQDFSGIICHAVVNPRGAGGVHNPWRLLYQPLAPVRRRSIFNNRKK